MSIESLRTSLADRYRIAHELGAGGMATVYLAEDLKHHRQVAIKVLHAELSALLGPERFLKEIELTASLQHPHILPLFDSGNANGLLYYVMPFVDGETLRNRLEHEKQLPITDALRIASEVADALQYAHDKGVVHRDIKPENILLQNGHALVADFGIALAVQEAGGQRMTQTGLSLGTPQYMSPEQAMGEREIGPRSDIYSLGAVTYEMLAGEPPFTGANTQAIVARVLTEERDARLRFLAILSARGYGRVAAGMHIHPSDDPKALAPLIQQFGLTRAVDVFRGSRSGREDERTFARRTFPLTEIAAAYRRFLKDFAPFASSHGLDDATAFALRLAVSRGYLDAAWDDPGLPRQLLPPDWPGADARRLARRLYERCASPSHRFGAALAARLGVSWRKEAP